MYFRSVALPRTTVMRSAIAPSDVDGESFIVEMLRDLRRLDYLGRPQFVSVSVFSERMPC